ncbi:hypothetical protein [Bacillus mycoides]|uniref:hypothetical protein n=1 Tax=Bacillus mycoides TaxID=1405 RepID=UPI001642D541|nr:hypothetical protein [Bacillus mycoides]
MSDCGVIKKRAMVLGEMKERGGGREGVGLRGLRMGEHLGDEEGEEVVLLMDKMLGLR